MTFSDLTNTRWAHSSDNGIEDNRPGSENQCQRSFGHAQNHQSRNAQGISTTAMRRMATMIHPAGGIGSYDSSKSMDSLYGRGSGPVADVTRNKDSRRLVIVRASRRCSASGRRQLEGWRRDVFEGGAIPTNEGRR